MKKITLIFIAIAFCTVSYGQESVVKISASDAPFGMYEVSYERTFNEGMNNIKSSGRLRGQGKWPNILTKSSFQVSFGFITSSHSQNFGTGLTARIDTNSNQNYQYDFSSGGFNLVDPSDIATVVDEDDAQVSVERKVVTKTSGISFGAEYRSYFKTYKQNIGDAPRGWYIAPFFNFTSRKLDFDDNTEQEVNNAMNYLMYGDPSNATNAFNLAFFNGYQGAWEGDEATGSQSTATNANSGNGFFNPLNYDLSWHDVSFTQNEAIITAGLAIGRQWLIKDKFSIDIQIGPKYQIVTRSERVFNGNDTWNNNQQINNINDYSTLTNTNPNYFLQLKYGDVMSFDGSALDGDVANGYFFLNDEDGNRVIIKGKDDDSQLNYTTGFYRELPGLTDFGKLETYRIKLRVGYAF